GVHRGRVCLRRCWTTDWRCNRFDSGAPSDPQRASRCSVKPQSPAGSETDQMQSIRSNSLVIRSAAELVCVSRTMERTKRGAAMRDLAIISDGAVIVRDGLIDWIGPTQNLPPLPDDAHVIDASGETVLPGFVDSHTHLLFAGSREDEFEQRLLGLSYQEVAARGGGINSTVQRVRSATKAELKNLA